MALSTPAQNPLIAEKKILICLFLKKKKKIFQQYMWKG